MADAAFQRFAYDTPGQGPLCHLFPAPFGGPPGEALSRHHSLPARAGAVRAVRPPVLPDGFPHHPRRVSLPRRGPHGCRRLTVRPAEPLAAPLHGNRRGGAARHPHARRGRFSRRGVPRDGKHPHPGETHDQRPARADQGPPREQRGHHEQHPGRHHRGRRCGRRRVLQQLFPGPRRLRIRHPARPPGAGGARSVLRRKRASASGRARKAWRRGARACAATGRAGNRSTSRSRSLPCRSRAGALARWWSWKMSPPPSDSGRA